MKGLSKIELLRNHGRVNIQLDRVVPLLFFFFVLIFFGDVTILIAQC